MPKGIRARPRWRMGPPSMSKKRSPRRRRRQRGESRRADSSSGSGSMSSYTSCPAPASRVGAAPVRAPELGRGAGTSLITRSRGRRARLAERFEHPSRDRSELRVDATHPRRRSIGDRPRGAGPCTSGSPRADPTVIDRLRVGARPAPRRPIGERRVKARPNVAEVGREVIDPAGGDCPAPADPPQLLRSDALQSLEKGRVDAHLEDRTGLDRARQLRVGDVVAPAASPGLGRSRR